MEPNLVLYIEMKVTVIDIEFKKKSRLEVVDMKSLTIFHGFFLFLFLIGTTIITTSAHSNPWSSFHNLTGCHHGENRPGLSSVKSYLNQFGYLASSGTYDDDFDDRLESAVRAYQKKFHIKPTGVLDDSTVEFMMQPRCGVPDIDHDSNSTVFHGRYLYSYFSGRPTWPPNRRALTYFLSTSGSTFPPTVLRPVFARAFSRWQSVTKITFTEVSSPTQADIDIRFARGDHGDGHPFDGPGGVLAHAYAPTNGRMHIDASDRWAATASDAPAPELNGSTHDLESVVVHEIGHILGLGHSEVRGAVMFASIAYGVRKVHLDADDVRGVQGLYGVK